MEEDYGGVIPLWAQRLLLQYQVDCGELEPRIAEMKASTASKLVAFKALKEKKEKEQEQAILDETVRVNKEILRRREQVTTDSGQFRDLFEAKMTQIRDLEKDLHEKSSTLPKLSEALLKIQSELDGLKKQEETLNQTFAKLSATVTEEAKKVALADPAWADLDLLEPVFQSPEPPTSVFTARRADTPKNDSSAQRTVRAGRTEVIRILLGERSRAIVESLMHKDRNPLMACIETMQKEDPVDPVDPSAKLLISRGIQNMHTFFGKDVELIEWLIQKEIGRATEPKQVFPEGSPTFAILSTFAMRYGSTFLKDSIRDSIYRILKDDKPYELNPDKIVKNVEWIDLNIKAVKTLAYDILIEIVGSSFKIPMQLRKVLSFLKAEMSRKFPNDGFSMVGRLLFDSLFCKALEKPEECNIGIKEVPDRMRPLLRVLSGMIGRVSRNEPFTDDIHLPLNEFVSNYLGLARKFLTDSMKIPDREIWATVTPCSLSSCTSDIEEGLGKLSLNQLATLAKRTSELDGQKLYSFAARYHYIDRIKILQDQTLGDPLTNMEKTHPFAEELFDVLFDEECAVIDAIAAIATPKPDFDPQPLATAIITCSLYRDPTGGHAESLVRIMLRKEMSAFSNNSTSSQALSRLLHGFGAAMYAAFARVLGTELLQEVIPPFLENVRKGKLGKLDKKGCGNLGTFVGGVAMALHRAPLPMWKLASFLTRQLMDPGPGLFLVKFIGQALDNPAKYMTKMPEGKERDKFQKRLAAIRLFLNRVATTEQLTKIESKHFSEANPIIKEVHDSWVSTNDTWSSKDPSASSSTSAAPIPTIWYTWEDVRPAIKTWIEFVDTDTSFELLLAKEIQSNISFTLGDLVFGWALPAGPRTASISLTPAS